MTVSCTLPLTSKVERENSRTQRNVQDVTTGVAQGWVSSESDDRSIAVCIIHFLAERSMHTLGQWSWLASVTWCKFMTLSKISDGQRVDCTAPKCTWLEIRVTCGTESCHVSKLIFRLVATDSYCSPSPPTKVVLLVSYPTRLATFLLRAFVPCFYTLLLCKMLLKATATRFLRSFLFPIFCWRDVTVAHVHDSLPEEGCNSVAKRSRWNNSLHWPELREKPEYLVIISRSLFKGISFVQTVVKTTCICWSMFDKVWANCYNLFFGEDFQTTGETFWSLPNIPKRKKQTKSGKYKKIDKGPLMPKCTQPGADGCRILVRCVQEKISRLTVIFRQDRHNTANASIVGQVLDSKLLLRNFFLRFFFFLHSKDSQII